MPVLFLDCDLSLCVDRLVDCMLGRIRTAVLQDQPALDSSNWTTPFQESDALRNVLEEALARCIVVQCETFHQLLAALLEFYRGLTEGKQSPVWLATRSVSSTLFCVWVYVDLRLGFLSPQIPLLFFWSLDFRSIPLLCLTPFASFSWGE